MKSSTLLRTLGAATLAVVFSTSAMAQHAGGGHAGGGGHAAVGHAGVGHTAGAAHFTSAGVSHFNAGAGAHYGARTEYSGYRGGYGHRWGGYGWGWGGLGVGLYFASLPLYYNTYWYGGVPYYYADNTYYLWDGSAGEYETVSPPAPVVDQAQSGSPGGNDLMVYPKGGQSAEQQAQDKAECHQWAATQTGFSASAVNSSDFMRAEAACLTGRNYSVR